MAERDDLEPTSVATGRIVLAVGAVFLTLFAALAAMAVFYGLRIGPSWRARAHPFPAPALETNVDTRSTADRDHGPKPYRELPATERATHPGAPDPALDDAMRAIAARGGAAYDPAPATAR